MNYSETLKEFGPNDPRSVKWGTKQTQYFRFKILCEIADLTNASVVDYGCGLGDLYDYLRTQGFKGLYKGYDTNFDLLEAAEKKYPASFMHINPDLPTTSECDYVLLSGVFNEEFEGRAEQIKTTLTRLFNFAKHGLAYNGLYKGDMGISDPAELFKFANTLTPFVTLRQDYREGNFTLYLYKNKGVDF